MSVLMIVESPAKAKKIRGYFKDFTVVATVGHFQDLPAKEMGIAPPEHKINYVTLPGKEEVIKRILGAAKSASVIYIATDLDREGEAIGGQIVNLLGNRYKHKTHRIVYNEISKKAINEAIKNKRDIHWNLVRAQEGRRAIDRYAGYLVSPVLTKLFQNQGLKESFSSGRVQSVVLRMLHERKLAIQNFVSKEHYGAIAHIQHSDVLFNAVWLNGLAKGELMMDRTKAESVVRNTNYLTVTNIDSAVSPVSPPKPLTTSTYCQLMASKLGLTTKQAMDAAQKLFEAGLITYHRTDSVAVAEDFVKSIWAFASSNKLPLPASPRQYKDGKNAQAGHECLRVADIHLFAARQAGIDDAVQQDVYQWVWRISLESQLADGTDTVSTICFQNDKADTFFSRSRNEKTPGWRHAADRFQKVNPRQQPHDEDTTDDCAPALPDLRVGEILNHVQAELDIKHTKPPAVYTEKTLTAKLDKMGIGRPSTYAQTYERLLSMQYATRDAKNRLQPTEKGSAVVEALLPHFSFMQYDYTACVEECLDAIEAGKSQYLKLVTKTYCSLVTEIERFEKSPLPDAAIESVKLWNSQSHPTPITKGKSTGKKTNKKPSSAHSSANTRPVYQRSKHGHSCPSCSSGKLQVKSFAQGNNKGKEFMGCTNFPSCKHFGWLES